MAHCNDPMMISDLSTLPQVCGYAWFEAVVAPCCAEPFRERVAVDLREANRR